MSNLSQQFDANALQVSQAIKNNKARLTRVLNDNFIGPRKKTKKRRGLSHMSSGVVYTTPDEKSTMIHWQSETHTVASPEVIQAKIQKIHDVLKGAGYSVTLKDGGVHVQH